MGKQEKSRKNIAKHGKTGQNVKKHTGKHRKTWEIGKKQKNTGEKRKT